MDRLKFKLNRRFLFLGGVSTVISTIGRGCDGMQLLERTGGLPIQCRTVTSGVGELGELDGTAEVVVALVEVVVTVEMESVPAISLLAEMMSFKMATLLEFVC